MLNGCDNDIIKIDYQVFSKYSSLFNTINIPDKYLKKKEELFVSHNCFKSSFEHQLTQFIEKKFSNHPKHSDDFHKTNKRLYIISSNFSKEENLKKSYTGCLNKLTEENKTKIYEKVIDMMKSTEPVNKHILYDILWNFIKQSPDKLYIDLLQKTFEQEFLLQQFSAYVRDKTWYPDEYILTENIFGLREDKYDIYCNYVKWKKMSINSLKAWNLIFARNKPDLYDKLYDDVIDLLFETYHGNYKERKHVFDFCMDKLYLMMLFCKHEDVLSKIQSLNLDYLDMSSKFLIKNLLEL